MDASALRKVIPTALLIVPLVAAASLCNFGDWFRSGEVLVETNACGGQVIAGYSCGGLFGNQPTLTYLRFVGPRQCLLA